MLIPGNYNEVRMQSRELIMEKVESGFLDLNTIAMALAIFLKLSFLTDDEQEQLFDELVREAAYMIKKASVKIVNKQIDVEKYSAHAELLEHISIY